MHAHVCTRLPHPLTLPFKLLLPPVLSLSFGFYSDSLNLQPADLQIPAETLQLGDQKAEVTFDSLGCLSRELLIPAGGPGAQETTGPRSLSHWRLFQRPSTPIRASCSLYPQGL